MKIIDQLPISRSGWIVPTPDGAEEVKPYQIIVLVSIADREASTILPERCTPIPGDPRYRAIITISPYARNNSSDGRRSILPRSGQIEVGTFTIPLLAANRLDPPEPTGYDRSERSEPPFRLELKRGIAVYPPDVPNPARLPILGLRGLIRNRLRLTIDGDGRNLTLESPSA